MRPLLELGRIPWTLRAAYVFAIVTYRGSWRYEQGITFVTCAADSLFDGLVG